MNYPEPTKTFDALDHARNKVIRANQFQELVVQQYRGLYEEVWGLNPEGGTRYSVQEMQSILDVLGPVAIDMIQDGGAFAQFIATAYPGVLEEKYLDTAFDYTIGQSGITVTALREVWQKKEEANEPDAN